MNWQKELRYWFEWFGVALCVRIIPLLPLALLRLFADIAGWLAFHLDRKSRAIALANLDAVFGEEKNLLELRAIARRSVQLFGRSVLELFWTPRLNSRNLDRYLYFEDDVVVKERCANNNTPPAPIFLTIHLVISNGPAHILLPRLPGLHTDAAAISVRSRTYECEEGEDKVDRCAVAAAGPVHVGVAARVDQPTKEAG